MEIKEAIECLNSIIFSMPGKYEAALQMAISALEKQEPKSPVTINKNGEFDGNFKKVCPSCSAILMERITTSEMSFPRIFNLTGYCCRCGQKFDWEGIKEDI